MLQLLFRYYSNYEIQTERESSLLFISLLSLLHILNLSKPITSGRSTHCAHSHIVRSNSARARDPVADFLLKASSAFEPTRHSKITSFMKLAHMKLGWRSAFTRHTRSATGLSGHCQQHGHQGLTCSSHEAHVGASVCRIYAATQCSYP